MKNRDLILFLVIGLCVACLTGCVQFRYGQKQGQEQRESIVESARMGQANENTGLWEAARRGWREDGYRWDFANDVKRGWNADKYRARTP